MEYMEYPPHPGLTPFIKCYWSLSDFSVIPSGYENQFLTEGGMELVFNLGDPFSVINGNSVFKNHEGAFAIGSMTKAQRGSTSGKCHLFGVCFLPGGAMPFLSLPPLELTDCCTDVENFEDARLKTLDEYLRNESVSVQARIEILNRFFCQRLDRPSVEYRLLTRSIQMIRQSNGLISIELLAQRLGINRRRLERLFLKMVGIPPKKISRLFRIKNAIGCMASPSFNGWAELAISAGYFDQAHFIREFKMVTGSTPSSYKDFQTDVDLLSIV